MRKLLPLSLIFSCCLSTAVSAQQTPPDSTQEQATKSAKKVDRSGKPRKGKASYYAKKFAGKKMADGTPMNPNANVAASKTLPLGTKAKVTNLQNGKSAEVEIRDRGPYVKDRIVDVSPKVADQLEIEKQGVAPVEVKPIELPPKDSAKDSGNTDAASGNR